jgi:hypothetical protein
MYCVSAAAGVVTFYNTEFGLFGYLKRCLNKVILVASKPVVSSTPFPDIILLKSIAKRMSQVESVSLSDSLLPRVKVHATVVFSILNSFTRRTPRDSRVVGTLLGEVRDGVVVVSGISCS